MLELIQKIKDYTEAGIILNHMELFDELQVHILNQEEEEFIDIMSFEKGKFLEYNLENDFDKNLGMITRQYYEFVDRQLLENMPDNILYDLEIKIHNEMKRRGED